MRRENHSSPGAKRRNRMKEVAVILRCVYPDKGYHGGEFLHHVCAARLPFVNNKSRKFNTLNRCRINVGPPSATLKQHKASTRPMYNVRWIIVLHSKPLLSFVGVLSHCSTMETFVESMTRYPNAGLILRQRRITAAFTEATCMPSVSLASHSSDIMHWIINY